MTSDLDIFRSANELIKQFGDAADIEAAMRADAALAAGCDLVLHCNGDMGEMEAVAAACSPLSEAARARLGRAESMRRPPQPLDREDARARLEELLEGTP